MGTLVGFLAKTFQPITKPKLHRQTVSVCYNYRPPNEKVLR